MPTQEDVRRIAMALPDVAEDEDSFTFRAYGRMVAWLWPERIDPKKRRFPNPDVIVLRVRSELDKHALIEMAPDALFTEPHYDGYSAVLVRLSIVDPSLLERLIADSWAIAASRPGRHASGA